MKRIFTFDTGERRTGRTIRLAEFAIASANAGGSPYIVVSHPDHASYIAGLVGKIDMACNARRAQSNGLLYSIKLGHGGTLLIGMADATDHRNCGFYGRTYMADHHWAESLMDSTAENMYKKMVANRVAHYGKYEYIGEEEGQQ